MTALVVAEVVAEREIAPGIKINMAMTPLERHNIVAAARGLPTVQRPAGIPFGPAQGETSAAAPAGTVAGKAPPPAPTELERANRIAEFDREMQATGKQLMMPRDTSGRFATVQKAIDTRLAAFRALKPEQRTHAVRVQLERDLAPLYEQLQGAAADASSPPTGQQRAPAKAGQGALSQAVAGAQHRGLTAAGQKLEGEVLAEFKALPPAKQRDPATIDLYNVAVVAIRANEHGKAHISVFHPAMLHGYRLPDFLNGARGGQHYPATVINDLAKARAAGLSQQQVDAFIKTGMVRDGWLRA